MQSLLRQVVNLSVGKAKTVWQIRFMFAFRPLENSFRYPFLIVVCNAILFICVKTARAETILIRS